ncbi:hypothetical protein B0T14DRAFT_489984 [Immersiella caudata]|uniref:Uncharacterized protein n=1 Tax=Immersiella caudata TaxID=314043 RepID=A0AA39XCI8_9PEZI|nr:hypothetical protein B0T14DRAFT_489984 [Immersiella caudata]
MDPNGQIPSQTVQRHQHYWCPPRPFSREEEQDFLRANPGAFRMRLPQQTGFHPQARNMIDSVSWAAATLQQAGPSPYPIYVVPSSQKGPHPHPTHRQLPNMPPQQANLPLRHPRPLRNFPTPGNPLIPSPQLANLPSASPAFGQPPATPQQPCDQQQPTPSQYRTSATPHRPGAPSPFPTKTMPASHGSPPIWRSGIQAQGHPPALQHPITAQQLRPAGAQPARCRTNQALDSSRPASLQGQKGQGQSEQPVKHQPAQPKQTAQAVQPSQPVQPTLPTQAVKHVHSAQQPQTAQKQQPVQPVQPAQPTQQQQPNPKPPLCQFSQCLAEDPHFPGYLTDFDNYHNGAFFCSEQTDPWTEQTMLNYEAQWLAEQAMQDMAVEMERRKRVVERKKKEEREEEERNKKRGRGEEVAGRRGDGKRRRV